MDLEPDRHLATVATALLAAMPGGVQRAELRFVVETQGMRLVGRFIGNTGTTRDAKLPADAIRAVMRFRADPAGGSPWRVLVFRWSDENPRRCEFDIVRGSGSGSVSCRVSVDRVLASPGGERSPTPQGPGRATGPGMPDAGAGPEHARVPTFAAPPGPGHTPGPAIAPWPGAVPGVPAAPQGTPSLPGAAGPSGVPARHEADDPRPAPQTSAPAGPDPARTVVTTPDDLFVRRFTADSSVDRDERPSGHDDLHGERTHSEERARSGPPTSGRLEDALAATPASDDPVADALDLFARIRGPGRGAGVEHGPVHGTGAGEGSLEALARVTGVVPEWFGAGSRAWASLHERCRPIGSSAVAISFTRDDRTVDQVLVIRSGVDGIRVADLRARSVTPMDRGASAGPGTLYAEVFDESGRWIEQRPPSRPEDIDDNARARAEYTMAVRRHHARGALVQFGRVPIDGTRICLVPDRGALRIEGGRLTPRRAAGLAVELARDVLIEAAPPGESARRLVRLTPRGRVLVVEPGSTGRRRPPVRWVNPVWIGTRVLSEVRGLHGASNGGARRAGGSGDQKVARGHARPLDEAP